MLLLYLPESIMLLWIIVLYYVLVELSATLVLKKIFRLGISIFKGAPNISVQSWCNVRLRLLLFVCLMLV